MSGTTDLPRIECSVTFLTTAQGGRQTQPKLSGKVYWPHIVVGDPAQREARVSVIAGIRTLTEDYLGVVFEEGPDEGRLGTEYTSTLVLMYFPEKDYSALVPGATFTIREGGKIVGFGTVQRRLNPSTD